MVDAAIIGGLLTNLAPLIRDELSIFWSFKKDVEKLSSTISSLNAVLEDADTKIKLEKMDKQTEDWLRKLKVVVYEVRYIMDDCTFEDHHLQVKRLNASSSTRVQVFNCIAHPFSKCTLTRLKIGHKIKDVLEKLDQFSSERTNFNLHLPEVIHDSKSTSWRETMSKLSEKVYGRDKEKEEIVHILVHTSPDALSVIPILGLGGLGKTTLTQMVFNDEEITKSFDVKFWVCVSEEFDIKLVIKAILGVTNAASLEILQNEIQDKLRGKKYLIVLDDVWNENVDEWNKLRSILDCGSKGAFILTTTRKRNVAEIMKTQGIQPFELSSLSDDDCWQLFEERAFMYGTPKTTNFICLGKEISKKCKGVPLVAKTLGGQLRFKSDENEWLKIRDSQMWEIFENKESILPILLLSYYDLPYPLRRCFAFCAIFPKDTEIEKQRLIQMWRAHDLIPINKNKEGENDGNTIWDGLCWRSFFQDEKERISFGKVKRTCKMHDFMHDLAQSVMKDECFTLDANSSSKDFSSDIRHVTIMVNSLINVSIDSLKKIGGLQSIILHPNKNIADETFSKEILSVLKKFSYLRVFEVSNFVKSKDLLYVGCLKHLRYLDLSSNICLKTLPNSICDSLNLQTLKLNGCYNLESLPRNMKDLINLQHLYLDDCWKLRDMPGGMGRLKGLKTLSLIVVGKKDRDCQLDEFKDLDIRGCLEIRNLERVSDASIERGISMAKMSSIYKLELEWKDNDEDEDETKKTRDDDKIGEALEVSSSCLKILKMKGYKGVNIPKWVGMSFATLTVLILWRMDNVEHIFTMNNMNTSSASRNDMNEMVFMSFPLLEELEISGMKNVRELILSTPPISTIRVFPNLLKIKIEYCPKLGALPPRHHLKSLKDVSVVGQCSDELFDSILDFSGQLTRLSVGNVKEISVIFSAVASRSSNDMNGTVAPLLEKLDIGFMENLRELVSPPCIPITTATTTGYFPNLLKIEIIICPKLRALPPPHHLKSLKEVKVYGECTDELLYSISNLSALTHLNLVGLNKRSVLFGGGDNDDDKISAAADNNNNINELAQGEGGGGAPAASSTFQSLGHLEIYGCDKLSCFFDEKLARGGGGSCFTNLNYLYIDKCPELMISVEQWRILTHSLRILRIRNCPKLVPSSKVEEAEEVMALLRSLRERLGSWNINVDILKGKEQRAI